MKKNYFLRACCACAALTAFGLASTQAADNVSVNHNGEQAQVLDTLTVLMNDLDDIQVVAKRVQQTTSNHEVLDNATLNQDNTGQNLPYLLSTVPALQVTSDDGLGVGYTYFRIRGTDHTRINMTVNDVPLNDQESQTVFWVNMTDMAASMSSIDVQRGVGTSTNGSASFGASLNMQTGDQDTVSHYTLSFNGGMYNTFREMLSAHIVLPNQWQANARFSKVNSDGFLYRATSDLYSYYTDLGWYGRRTQVVARFFGGNEKTGMGWDGVTRDVAYGLNGADRRYNPAGEYTTTASDGSDSTAYYDNQTDNYAQQHAQLSVNHRFNHNWSLSATLHYTHGGGYYEQYETKDLAYFGFSPYDLTIGHSDGTYETTTVEKADAVYRKGLNNHFAGLVMSTKYISEPLDAQIGLAANDYIGQHYGTILHMHDELYAPQLTPNQEFYRSHSNKADANIYAKVNWRVINRPQETLSLYADLQYRYIHYTMSGINSEDLQELPLTVDYHFFNPKAGLTYQNHGHLLYGSFAIANREPSRDNYTENIQYHPDTKEYSGTMPKAERLYDYELGYTYAHPRLTVGANFYFMDYDNQLVLTGRVNDVGAQSTTNVKDSYRMGAELTAGVKILDWFRWDGNFVLSRNKILGYTETITRYDADYNWLGEKEVYFPETTIAFSPMITAMSLFTFDVAGFLGTIQTNVTSKQYLDNTQNETAALKAYTTTNINLQYQLPMTKWCGRPNVPQIRLLCQINNVFNAKYASNGGSDCSYFEDDTACWPWYYAQAGINVHAGFVVNW